MKDKMIIIIYIIYTRNAMITRYVHKEQSFIIMLPANGVQRVYI